MNLKCTIAVLAIMLAGPTTALAQRTAPSAVEKQIGSELDRITELTRPQMEAMQASSGLYLRVVSQTSSLMALLNQGQGRAEADKWLSSWEPQVQAELTQLRNRVRDFKPYKDSDAPLLFAGGAIAGMDIPLLRETPTRNRTLIAGILDQIERTERAIHAAAYGDPKALQSLRAELVSGDGVILRVANGNMEGSVATLQPNSPGREFLLSLISANLAHLAYNDALAVEIGGGTVDPAAVAEAMRKNIAQAKQRQNALRASIKQGLATPAAGDSALGERVSAIMASYRDSADVEQKILSVYELIAEDLAQGGPPSRALPALPRIAELQKARAEQIYARAKLGG